MLSVNWSRDPNRELTLAARLLGFPHLFWVGLRLRFDPPCALFYVSRFRVFAILSTSAFRFPLSALPYPLPGSTVVV